MRILHVITSLNPPLGGTVECAKQIAQALQSLNCAVDIVCLDQPDEAWLRDFSTKVFALGRPAIPIFYSPSLRLWQWLNQNCESYDAVVVHGLWQFQTLASGFILRRKKIPYLVYTHGMLMKRAVYNTPIKAFKKLVYWYLVERTVLNNAAAILMTSTLEREWSTHALFKVKTEMVVIGNGIQTQRDFLDDQAIFVEKTSTPSLLVLGRLHPVKGIDLLLEAISSLGESAPHLLVAGSGDPPAYEAEMQKHARKLGLSNKVTFLGHVAGTEKLSLLKSVWAVVSTSHHENFGFSIAEALSVGTPVLLTRNVATYVQVVDGNAGVVFNHTVKDCANAIQSFIEAPVHMRAKYGANAHICFEKNFRIIAPARKLLETVQRLLKGKKG